uniref:Uncharacterized protein n=1 Tax=Myripristis murdjan TaxID=586833 RepID=A0A667XHL2_9TELE
MSALSCLWAFLFTLVDLPCHTCILIYILIIVMLF